MLRHGPRVGLVIAVAVLGCTRSNPAFDELDELGELGEDESESGDGDGDPSTTGDGDGDPTTAGDGDGDPSTTGDGDGDPSTTGDGDGDPSTTGDGDGDPSTTGDGDGDGDPIECQQPIDVDPYPPAIVTGGITVDLGNAPGFTEQQMDCQTLTICVAAQPECGPNTAFIYRINSGGLGMGGNLIGDVFAIQMAFTPGKPSCGMPPLIFDNSQTITIHAINDENNPIVIPARLPCFEGTELRLWVAADGSTFYDGELQQPAALW